MFCSLIILQRFGSPNPSATNQARRGPIIHPAVISPAFITFLGSGRCVDGWNFENYGNQLEIRPFAGHSG
jgi:hypothetical protein